MVRKSYRQLLSGMTLRTRLAVSAPSPAMLAAGAAILLWVLYAAVIAQTLRESATEALLDAAANVAPLALLAAFMHAFLKAQVMARAVVTQAVFHVGLALAFTFTWYALIILCLAISSGVRGGGFDLIAFAPAAFTWQLFQGLIFYATVAATCNALRGGRRAADVTIVASPPSLQRYLTRLGDVMIPVDVDEIVSITGSQDYAEVATLSGDRHLVRMSLNEFQRRLQGRPFLRVHRSTLINFGLLTSAENAGGGRMLAHMRNGDTVITSRTGARALRAQVV